MRDSGRNPCAWWVIASLLLASQAALAAPRVAVVMWHGIPPYQQALEGFTKTLACEIEKHDVKSDPDSMMAGIRENPPDLVLAFGSHALKFARKFKDIPVVFAMVLKPGALPSNVAGVSMSLPAEIHLQGLKLVAPEVQSLGIVYNPALSANRVEEFKQAGKALGINVVAAQAGSKQESFSAIKLLGGRVDALWMVLDKDTVDNFNLLLSIAIKEKIPLATFSHRYVADGALLAMIPEYEHMGVQAAEIAGKILDGTSPSEIGTTTPREYYYAINVETALKIGVGVPPAVLEKKHKLYKSD